MTRFLTAALMAVALLEFGTRLLLPDQSYERWRRASLRYEYHPVYHWRMRPGDYAGRGGILRINANGLRGREAAVPKPPGTLRIVCLGGSSTFSYLAARGQTWPVLLKHRLKRALGRPVEVINAGTPGYSTYQSSMRFEYELVDLEPDLVLVYHMWNDLKLFSMDDPDAMIAKWDAHGRFNEISTLLDLFPFLDALSNRSQFVTHARFAWVKVTKSLRGVEDEGWIYETLDQIVRPEGLAFYRANLERIARVARERGVRVGIIDQVLYVTPEPDAFQRSRIHYEYVGFDHPTLVEAIGRARDANHELAEKPGVWNIDTDAFVLRPETLRDHVHLHQAGLAELAAIVAPQVLAILADPAFVVGSRRLP